MVYYQKNRWMLEEIGSNGKMVASRSNRDSAYDDLQVMAEGGTIFGEQIKCI